MLRITKCPFCGSRRISKVNRDWSGELKGRKYTVEGLEFCECQSCGEQVFDPAAMRRIEAESPAFRHRRAKRIA
jgi:YgiT-type zinc finger domain-containing protein